MKQDKSAKLQQLSSLSLRALWCLKWSSELSKNEARRLSKRTWRLFERASREAGSLALKSPGITHGLGQDSCTMSICAPTTHVHKVTDSLVSELKYPILSLYRRCLSNFRYLEALLYALRLSV